LARPLSQFLWELATLNRRFATPEKFGQLERSLKQRVLRIEDRASQRLYLRFLDDQLWDLRQRERRRIAPRQGEKLSLELAKLDRAWSEDATVERNSVVLIAAAIHYPHVARRDIDRFVNLSPKRKALADLHQTLLKLLAETPDIEPESLKNQLQSLGFGVELTRTFASPTYRAHRFARPYADDDVVTRGWNSTLSRIQLPVLREQLDEAVSRMGAEPNADDWDQILLLRQMYEDENIEAQGMRETSSVIERTAEWWPGGRDARPGETASIPQPPTTA
jgi:hypothetical protein